MPNYEPDEEYMSFKPSEAVAGGGGVAEGHYTIIAARCMTFDFNGKAPVGPVLQVEYQDKDGISHTQFYSAGSIDNWTPSADGKKFKKQGSSRYMNNSTICYMFWQHAIKAGLPEDKIGNDCTVLVGLEVDVVHKLSEEREINGQKKKATLVPVLGKIYPSTEAKQPDAAKSKANGSQQNTNKQLGTKAADALLKALQAAPNHQLDKKSLTGNVYKQISPNDTDRANMLQLCIQDQFLSSLVDIGVIYDPDKAVAMYVGG